MPAPSEKNSSVRIEWLAGALVSVAILWLHFHFWQNAGGLWRDEVNLVNLASSPSLTAMTYDSFPILMPLLVKTWATMGGTDSWLRLLGLLSGLAIPAAFWAVARATRQPPLFSLVLFGLNSLLICYGDSLRGYGMGSALIVFALAAMWSLLKNPNWQRAGTLALAATLSVQALYQNSLLFFAICLGGFAVCARQKNFSAALKILCAGIVAAISLLPYGACLAGLPQSAVELRRGFSPFITSLNFEMATGFPFETFAVVWKILAVITVGLALFSLRRANHDDKTEGRILPLFAGATLAAVTLLFVGFLWFAAVVARPWYFLPPLALAAACFDFGISPARLPRLVRAAVFGFLIGTALVAVPEAQSDLRGHFTNVDRLAVRVAAHGSRVRRSLRVVGDEDHRLAALVARAPEPIQDLRAGREVQVPRRLVRQEERGPPHQRAGERDALLLAARKLGAGKNFRDAALRPSRVDCGIDEHSAAQCHRTAGLAAAAAEGLWLVGHALHRVLGGADGVFSGAAQREFSAAANRRRPGKFSGKPSSACGRRLEKLTACGLTPPGFTASFPLLGAKRGSVGDKQFVR